jgi:predicted transcriptional regulator
MVNMIELKNNPYIDIYNFLIANKNVVFNTTELRNYLNLSKSQIRNGLKSLKDRNLCKKEISVDGNLRYYSIYYDDSCSTMDD